MKVCYVTSLLDYARDRRDRADEFADTLKIASIFSRYTIGPLWADIFTPRRKTCGAARARPGYDGRAGASLRTLLLMADRANEGDRRFPAKTRLRRRLPGVAGNPRQQYLSDQHHRTPGDQRAVW